MLHVFVHDVSVCLCQAAILLSLLNRCIASRRENPFEIFPRPKGCSERVLFSSRLAMLGCSTVGGVSSSSRREKSLLFTLQYFFFSCHWFFASPMRGRRCVVLQCFISRGVVCGCAAWCAHYGCDNRATYQACSWFSTTSRAHCPTLRLTSSARGA